MTKDVFFFTPKVLFLRSNIGHMELSSVARLVISTTFYLLSFLIFCLMQSSVVQQYSKPNWNKLDSR